MALDQLRQGFLLSASALAVACSRDTSAATSNALPPDVAPFASDCPAPGVVANDPRQVWKPIAWKLSENPDLEMGEITAGSPYSFSQLGSAQQLPGSKRIAITETLTKEVRIFSESGIFITKIGREGDGPGEFRDLRVAAIKEGGDSIVIVDQSVGRITAISHSARVTSSRLIDALPPVVGFLTDDVVVTALRPFGGERKPSGVRYSRQIVQLQNIGPNPDTITLAYDSTASVAIQRAGSNVVQGGAWVPYRVDPSWAIGSRSVVITKGTPAQIKQFDSTGCVTHLISITGPLRSLPPGGYERWMEWGLKRVSDDAEARRQYEIIGRPTGLPAWERLHLDTEDFIWAEVFREQGDSTRFQWNVFSPNGSAVGSMDLPPKVEILQIGKDFLLGRKSDTLGFDYLVRYRLER